MNLADVIRQAAQNAGERAPHVGYSPPEFEKDQPESANVNTPTNASTEPSATAPEPVVAQSQATATQSEPIQPIAFDTTASNIEVESVHAETSQDEVAYDAVSEEPVSLPEGPSGTVRSGNVVRLELFLSPDQMSSLFRALVATQHGMMTLREAANYLRVHTGTVEQMAQDGTIPALMIEGRWRFPKSSLDEWLSVQVFRSKGESDAA